MINLYLPNYTILLVIIFIEIVILNVILYYFVLKIVLIKLCMHIIGANSIYVLRGLKYWLLRQVFAEVPNTYLNIFVSLRSGSNITLLPHYNIIKQ